MDFRPAPPKPNGPSGFASYLPIVDRGLPVASADGRAFVHVPAANPGGYLTFPVRSRAFQDWFYNQAFAEYQTIPTSQAWNAVCRHIEAQAFREQRFRHLHIGRRIARGAGDIPKILIDLANPDGQFVEISPEGWRVATAVGVLFQTSCSTCPLPAPEPAAAGNHSQPEAPLETLRSALNLGPPNSPGWLRCLAWLLAAMRPHGPFPILVLRGPNSSGKSYAARALRGLVDPCHTGLNPNPSSVRDLLALARENWILAFDHVSALSTQLTDALCRLTSGVGIACREEGRREIIQQWVKRPILLTVTEDWMPPADLASRALIVDLPDLAPGDRLREEDILAIIQESTPKILGALYTALSAALRGAANRPAQPFTSRHADALCWALGAVSVLGCTEEEMHHAIDAPPPPHPIVNAVRTLLDHRPQWTGPATDLLRLLPFCQTPKGISQQLRKRALDLADAAIDIQFRRLPGGARIIALDASQNSAASPQPQHDKDPTPT
jgi:hypothetical protein